MTNARAHIQPIRYHEQYKTSAQQAYKQGCFRKATKANH